MSTLIHKLSLNPRLVALISLLIVGTLLSLSVIVGKLGIAAGASPLSFLWFSILGSGLMLLFGARFGAHAEVPLNRRTVEYGLVAGGLFVLPNVIGFHAVSHVGAGFMSLTFAFPILLTWLIALTIRMEKFNPLKALGVVAGLTGGVLIALSKGEASGAVLFWAILALASPVVIAIANIYRTLRWPEGVAPIALAALMLLFGAALLAPLVWIMEGGDFSAYANTDVRQLLLAEILIFAVQYVFYFLLQKIAGPVYLSQIGIVGAVIGSGLAVAFLGESLPAMFPLAALLIALGTALFQRAK